MDEESNLPEDERAIELSSIAAIFPEIVTDPHSPFKATLDIPVSPSTPLQVRFRQTDADPAATYYPTPPSSLDTGDEGGIENKNKTGTKNNDAAKEELYDLTFLPPLNLQIELPDGYPSLKPPLFTVTTYPAWLSQNRLNELIDDGKRLWEESGRDLVVFNYIDHLQQMSENAFGIAQDSQHVVVLPWDLKISLLDFDIKSKREKFEQETFECGVCLEPKKGLNCHRLLLCSHVFCIPCLQDFYNTCIQEGDVDNVKCLSPDCGKNTTLDNVDLDVPVREGQFPVKSGRRRRHDRTLNPSELLQIPLDQETVQRYVRLKRKKKLESDKSTVYCPRQWCQGAARSKRYPKPKDPINDDLEVSSDEEDGPTTFDPLGPEDQLPAVSERLAVCEDCGYAFCCVCRKGWHGELVRCYPRLDAERSEAEKASEAYIKKHTAPCPTCDTRCQKAMGCNHMICFQCGTHFCYLCSHWLVESNPYQHFNNPNNGCYMKLWELEGGDDSAEVPEWHPEDFLDDIDSEDDDLVDEAEWEIEDESGDDDNDDDGPNALNFMHRFPPPPAPIPPPNQGLNGGNAAGPDEAVRAAAAERQAQAEAIAQARRGRNHNQREFPPRQRQPQARNAAPILPAGLQRFLNLVRDDREDEWDSDELEDF